MYQLVERQEKLLACTSYNPFPDQAFRTWRRSSLQTISETYCFALCTKRAFFFISLPFFFT